MPLATGMHEDPAWRTDRIFVYSGWPESQHGELLGIGLAGTPVATTGVVGGGATIPGITLWSGPYSVIHPSDPGAPLPPAGQRPVWGPGSPALGGGDLPKGTVFDRTAITEYPAPPDPDAEAATVWRGAHQPSRLVHYVDPDTHQLMAQLDLPSGAMLTFEQFHVATGPDRSFFRLTSVRDPFDNLTRYEYASGGGGMFTGAGPLEAIVYQSGVREEWSYLQNGPTTVVTVEYVFPGESSPRADLTWGMVFEHRGSYTQPFVGTLLRRIYYPKTPYVVAGSHDTLFTTGDIDSLGAPDHAHLDHRVIELGYSSTWGGVERISSISEFRSDSLFGGSNSVTPSRTLATMTYQQVDVGGRWRIQTILGRNDYPDTGQPSWSFGPIQTEDDGSGYKRIASIEVTDPRGTATYTEHDGIGRVTLRRITPEDDASGRPRRYATSLGTDLPPETSTSDLYEEPSLTWEYRYAGDCGCGRPTLITNPSERTIALSWDSDGYPLSRQEARPATAPDAHLPAVWSWSWEPPPAGGGLLAHTGKFPRSASTPDHTWTTLSQGASTYAWHTVSSGPHAGRSFPTSVTWTSDSITRPYDDEDELKYERTYAAWSDVNVDGVADHPVGFLASERAQSVVLGTGWQYQIAWQYGDQGLPIRVDEGPASPQRLTTTWSWDAFGRPLGMVERVGSSQELAWTLRATVDGQITRAVPDAEAHPDLQAEESRSLLDEWGHVAVQLRKNRRDDGSVVAQAARDWVRNERHFDGERLMVEFQDRRALDAGDGGEVYEDGDALMLRTGYVHLSDGTPFQIELPNGALRTLSIDGYGTLFESRLTADGAQERIESRSFINEELEPVFTCRGEPGGLELWTAIERDAATGVVSSVLEPETDASLVPSAYGGALGGARWEYLHDAVGRVLDAKAYDGETELAHREYAYDELGRLCLTKDHALSAAGESGEREVVRLYEGVFLKSVTLPGGRTETRLRDPLGRVHEIVDALGNRTNFSYHTDSPFVLGKTVHAVEDVPGGGSWYP